MFTADWGMKGTTGSSDRERSVTQSAQFRYEFAPPASVLLITGAHARGFSEYDQKLLCGICVDIPPATFQLTGEEVS